MNIVTQAALLSLAALAGASAQAQEPALQQPPQPEPVVQQPSPQEPSVQEPPAPAADAVAPLPEPVKINARKNAGDLSYKSFFTMQALLQSYQPPEPRLIDFTYRLSFRELDGAARDAYHPDTWAVAIVGDTFDQVVPVSRGGYFVLPELAQALREGATVMFNTQTRDNTLDVEFKLRISPQQTLAYADFAKAIGEFKTLQNRIPWYRLGLRSIKNGKLDGLKACFRSDDGRIEIDGMAAGTRAQGNCQVLGFERAKAGAGAGSTIAFVGALELVTLDDMDS